jgi:hypothetical protein
MKNNPFLASLSAALLNLFGGRKIKPTVKDLQRADFPASTQRLGISFSEKIRDVFRFKWIRKK